MIRQKLQSCNFQQRFPSPSCRRKKQNHFVVLHGAVKLRHWARGGIGTVHSVSFETSVEELSLPPNPNQISGRRGDTSHPPWVSADILNVWSDPRSTYTWVIPHQEHRAQQQIVPHVYHTRNVIVYLVCVLARCCLCVHAEIEVSRCSWRVLTPARRTAIFWLLPGGVQRTNHGKSVRRGNARVMTIIAAGTIYSSCETQL